MRLTVLFYYSNYFLTSKVNEIRIYKYNRNTSQQEKDLIRFKA